MYSRYSVAVPTFAFCYGEEGAELRRTLHGTDRKLHLGTLENKEEQKVPRLPWQND